MDIVNLMLVAILIMLTAFFVAAEFSIVKVRPTKIEQLMAEGNKRAKYAKKLIDDLDRYLSACQLGITVTAIGLGWLGEPAVQTIFQPIFEGMNIHAHTASFISFILAFTTISLIHVVIGELVPKTIAIQKAESLTLLLARPLIFFYRIMFPFIWALNGSAQFIVRMLGFKPIHEYQEAHSEEEVRMIVKDSYKKGEINLAELTYVNNIFEFDETIVREIMVPRNEMVVLYKDSTLMEIAEIVRKEQYTRYPVADEDKDRIIGLVNVKDIFTDLLEGKQPKNINEYIRPIIRVPEVIPIRKLLLKMQRERIHMAVIHDEYGGTSGIVTVEDILEEIVGDIRDEFDDDEMPEIEEINEHTKVVSGRMHLEDLHKVLGVPFPVDEVDTLGGWVYSKNMELKEGTSIFHGGYQFIVDEMDRFQVKKVKIVNH